MEAVPLRVIHLKGDCAYILRRFDFQGSDRDLGYRMDLNTLRRRINIRSVFQSQDQPAFAYQPEQWRTDDVWTDSDDRSFTSVGLDPDAREQSRLLDLLGRINYKILTGTRVYVEVGGVVYKTLYGGYWCSVFTGIQHYLLRCEEVKSSMWTEETEGPVVVDLPIAYANGGWTAEGCSLSFMLTRD